MVLQQVYSNNLNPEIPNITQRFINAVGFFIDAPLITNDLEIDCFLQVYFDLGGREIARNLPLGKIEEQAILLNKTDTETLFFIPQEFVNSEHEMSLLFLASNNTFLEVFIVKQSINLIDELNIIKNKLDLIITNCITNAPSDSIETQQQFYFIN